MLTPKIPMTNLRKTDDFVVGGYARSRSWGTRVYTVVAVEKVLREHLYRNHDNPDTWQRLWTAVDKVTLKKIGETNKGRFKFTNCKPFTVHSGNGGTLSWYYPAKGI